MNENTESDTTTTTPEPTWPRVVTLKHPIDFGAERITRLEFQRGRLSHAKGLKLDGVPSIDDLLKIASRLSGQTTHVIERIDADDAGEVMGIALDFFARCLTGGSAP